jgi:hypothetical protein
MHNYAQSYLAYPKLEDALIQELRLRLHVDQYEWLQYCLHRIERHDDNEGREWAWIRLNQGTDIEQMITPDTTLKSLAFFEVNSVDYAPYVGQLSRYNISLYVWINKNKISTYNEDVTLFYAEKCIDVLRDNFNVENITRETRRQDVFNFSGLQESKFAATMGKYTGFKITADFYYDDHSCYNIQTMTTAIPLTDRVAFTSTNVVDGTATLTHVLNSTRITDVTVTDPNGKIIQLLAEPKGLTVSTVEFGISIGAGTYYANITALPMTI